MLWEHKRTHSREQNNESFDYRRTILLRMNLLMFGQQELFSSPPFFALSFSPPTIFHSFPSFLRSTHSCVFCVFVPYFICCPFLSFSPLRAEALPCNHYISMEFISALHCSWINRNHARTAEDGWKLKIILLFFVHIHAHSLHSNPRWMYFGVTFCVVCSQPHSPRQPHKPMG